MALDKIRVGMKMQTLVPTGIGTKEWMPCKVHAVPRVALTWLPYGGQVTVYIQDTFGIFRGVAKRDLDQLRKVPE